MCRARLRILSIRWWAWGAKFRMIMPPDRPIVGQMAQTHLQLFLQMRNRGYSAAELAMVAAAYRTATALFANRFRPCGRPFVAHLVGTSAILVWLKAPIPMVVAALSHAAYQEGDFANSLEGMTARKRKKLRAAIGPEAEELVAAYTVSSRSLTGIMASHARFHQMSPLERDILLIQLANELDDYRELASNHAANADERIEVIRQCGPQQAEMAEWLGHPELAEALRETYAESIAAFVPKTLQSGFEYGYEIVPESCQVRYNIHARRLGVKIRNRLRRHLGIG
jgi:(p)ppGpp synthase/HD superfamily hydrolase